MAKEIIQAKDFADRASLDNEVLKRSGPSAEKNATLEIRGTRGELAKLHLSDLTNVWGIPCVITDTPTQPKVINNAERGQKHPFGLNLTNNGENNDSQAR